MLSKTNIKPIRPFKIVSDYSPAGDQPKAIDELVAGLNNGLAGQTLLGVTGSGKTFTVAKVIEEVQRPTIVLAHNKTLAAQLYGEFKGFSPITRLSTLSLITTITNPRPMCLHLILLSKKMRR